MSIGQQRSPLINTPRESAVLPLVAVAVLNWNGFELTRACIRSLASLSTRHHLFVVDNGSDAPEAERLRSELAVEVVALPHNGGVAYGYNAAICHARELGYPYVLLLNNDVINVDPLMLDQLLRAVVEEPVAVASPLVLDDRGRIFSAGGLLSWWGNPGHRTSPACQHPYPVQWVDGSAMLVKVAAATRAGLLPEDYFLYWEEVDWCWRLRQAGYQCVVVPTTKIVHLRGRSSTSELAEYYLLRNGLLFHRRVGSPWQNMRYLARYFFRTLPAYLWKEGLLQRRMPQTLKVAARAVSWNISDAVARRSWSRCD